jgi:hypothetical protein
MASLLDRLFRLPPAPEPIRPGIYHSLAPEGTDRPYRLHLRVEADGAGVLIVNAATVLHLNPTATVHALLLIQGVSEQEAAHSIADRFRVGLGRALKDHRRLHDRILTLATTHEIDPVLFLDMERRDPYSTALSAPYRLDIALTYHIGPGDALDPLARRRVDRELSTDEWKQILSAAWEAGIPHVTFTGGEPTVREDLADLIAHAESLGQVTGLLTDGRRLSNAAYMTKLSQSGLDHILLTLDPQDPASMEGLNGALASDVFTAVHLTLTPEDASGTTRILDQLKALGVHAVSLSANFKTEATASALAEARHKAAILGMELVWDLPAPYSATNPIALELESPIQGAGRAFLYVEPDGDVLPAQGVDHVLGNILRDGWAKVWAAAKT